MILDGYLWGVRILIWVYFVISLILGLGIILYFNRELIKENYYKWRFPEKVIKIVVHYPTGIFRSFWRLIPDTDFFVIDGKNYNFADSAILKDNDFYVYKNEGILKAKIEDIEYNLEDRYKIRRSHAKWPEIHYFYNVPLPIDFNTISTELKLSATQLTDLKENDLVKKLLTMEAERSMLLFVMIITGINLLATFFIIAKIMGWVK